MTCLVDAQLPLALSRFLRSHGCPCSHVLDLALAQATDSEIWAYAEDHRMVLISKDEDFFQLATRPNARVQVIWIRLGNCRTATLLAAVERVWPEVVRCLAAGDRVVEIR